MKMIKELPGSCTTQDIITVCEDLQKYGHTVIIEHRGGMIRLYDDNADDKELDRLKARYAKLAQNAPSPDNRLAWDLYQGLMQSIERELIKKGVIL